MFTYAAVAFERGIKALEIRRASEIAILLIKKKTDKIYCMQETCLAKQDESVKPAIIRPYNGMVYSISLNASLRDLIYVQIKRCISFYERKAKIKSRLLRSKRH